MAVARNGEHAVAVERERTADSQPTIHVASWIDGHGDQQRRKTMKTIQLVNGPYVALVDDKDYKSLSQFRWFARLSKPEYTPYAVRYREENRDTVNVWMHRVIMNAKKGEYVDHINWDGLDNRRCNLRIATVSQNNFHSPSRKLGRSGFRGIHQHVGRRKPWQARIGYNGREYMLGSFTTLEEARAVRLRAEREFYGEFASTVGG